VKRELSKELGVSCTSSRASIQPQQGPRAAFGANQTNQGILEGADLLVRVAWRPDATCSQPSSEAVKSSLGLCPSPRGQGHAEPNRARGVEGEARGRLSGDTILCDPFPRAWPRPDARRERKGPWVLIDPG
jgi:hypothetical protein